MTVVVRIVKFPSVGAAEEFDALSQEPEADVVWVERPEDVGVPDLLVLPGSEATLSDLEWLRSTGMEAAVREAAMRGSLLFGICGGFQIMGRELLDPERLEGAAMRGEGLGIFDVTTTFTRDVIDEPSVGTGRGEIVPEGVSVGGFERHGGRSILVDSRGVVSLFAEPAKGGETCPLAIATRDYSAIGTYLHGILADPEFRGRLFERLRGRRGAAPGA